MADGIAAMMLARRSRLQKVLKVSATYRNDRMGLTRSKEPFGKRALWLHKIALASRDVATNHVTVS